MRYSKMSVAELDTPYELGLCERNYMALSRHFQIHTVVGNLQLDANGQYLHNDMMS